MSGTDPALDPELGVPGRRANRGGPYLMLIPLALSVAAVWWIRHPSLSLVPTRPPARADPDATHDVLGGETQLGGATLAFWLAPSEPDAGRQAFQAKALRSRYGLSEGESWRLRLEWRPLEGAKTAGEPASLDVGRLSIVDSSGTALAPIRLGRDLDPLATLLAPPTSPLVVGTSLDLFLWGRAPLPGARLAGLSDGSSNGEAALEVGLTSRPLRQGDLVGPMASLDAAAPGSSSKSGGKTAAPGASNPAGQGTNEARY
ncbi:MAG TPA: hypothetical protein VK843_03650 [Planctomycetota bacterium]|nr:hypothetical protein [Planctomycetota bacterium]